MGNIYLLNMAKCTKSQRLEINLSFLPAGECGLLDSVEGVRLLHGDARQFSQGRQFKVRVLAQNVGKVERDWLLLFVTTTRCNMTCNVT